MDRMDRMDRMRVPDRVDIGFRFGTVRCEILRSESTDIMHLKRTRNVRFSNIFEQSPFLSWTDGRAIKTPDQSPEFDATCAGAGNLPRLAC